MLGGPLPKQEKEDTTFSSAANVITEHSMLCFDQSSKNDPLIESVENFWNMDCLGIEDRNETSVYDAFLGDLQYNRSEKRYEVGLPWKLDPVMAGLPDNFTNSKKRLMSNIKSLKKNPQVLTEYHEIIKTQLRDGIIEKCSVEEPAKQPVH